jgi:2-succinyl-6-hydroxy-2,4-cyclohexadiene-1-carboxylate synthase
VTEIRRITAAPGVELWAEIAGEGAPLALVAGAGGGHATWDRLWPALTAAHRCIRYDLRGCGASTDLSSGLFSHTDDLLALLDGLGLERASVMGVSMGGRIALDFALAHPDRVERLVLVSPGLAGWDWSEAWNARRRALVETARSDLDGARELWFGDPLFATTRRDPVLAAELRAEIAADPGREWLEIAREAPCERPHIERLVELSTPVLLMTGAEDLEDFRVIAEALEGMVADLRRLDYPGAGHLTHMERAAEVAAETRAFLLSE